jgi:hypothetical protein
LNEVLEKNKNTERGNKKNKVRGFLFAERAVDQFVNSYADKPRKDRRKKKLITGEIPSEIAKV